MTDDAERRAREIADTLHAWSENSPDPDYFFGGDRETVFSTMQDTCADGAKIIRSLLNDLAALRAPNADLREAEKRMRERCAKIAAGFADAAAGDPYIKGEQAGREIARAIRALPTTGDRNAG